MKNAYDKIHQKKCIPRKILGDEREKETLQDVYFNHSLVYLEEESINLRDPSEAI